MYFHRGIKIKDFSSSIKLGTCSSKSNVLSKLLNVSTNLVLYSTYIITFMSIKLNSFMVIYLLKTECMRPSSCSFFTYLTAVGVTTVNSRYSGHPWDYPKWLEYRVGSISGYLEIPAAIFETVLRASSPACKVIVTS